MFRRSRELDLRPQRSSEDVKLTQVGTSPVSFSNFNASSSSSRNVDYSVNNGHDYANGDAKAAETTSLTEIGRRSEILESEDQPTSVAAAASTSASRAEALQGAKEEPVTWRSLPKKDQLAIITLARLSEPLAERSLAAYMFYQLRSFDSSLPDSTITSQGGILIAAFAGAQFLTAVWWGRAADTPWIGRKRVLLIGLFGTAIASIGVGFSKTFVQALCFRALAGALNGNIGVMRTMISEIIQEKRFQSRAFMLLPMCFNIGVVIGPILGGFLADPITSFPNVFGPGSSLGGKDGVGWMKVFPYGLPNLFSGFFISLSALGIILGLDETHPSLQNKPDHGRKLGKWIARMLCRRKRDTYSYTQLSNSEPELDDPSTSTALETYPKPETDVERDSTRPKPKEAVPVQPNSSLVAIITRNVVLTLISHFIFALHISSFNALVFLFLPSPRAPPPDHFTLRFTGGLGLSSSNVGLATAIMGIIGFPLQLFIYPALNARLGTLKGYRMFVPFSALAYVTVPFLAIMPDKPWIIWPALTFVLASQVLSRTFATTSTVILINNSSPSPAVLGTLHGVAQSVSSAARMLGPTVGGWGLGVGLRQNCVGAVWWAMTVLVGIHEILLWCIFEGDGHGGRA